MWTCSFANQKSFDEQIDKLEEHEIASNLVDLIHYGCGEWGDVPNEAASFNEAFKQLARLSSGNRTHYEATIAKKSAGPTVGKFAYEKFGGEKDVIEISPVGKKNTDRFYIRIGKANVEFMTAGHTRK